MLDAEPAFARGVRLESERLECEIKGGRFIQTK
jgi:hypothetical protein